MAVLVFLVLLWTLTGHSSATYCICKDGKKGQAVGSCDFSATATTSATPPTNVASGCTYPASATTSTGTGNGTSPTNSGTAPTGTTTPSSIIPPPPSSVFNSGLGPTGINVNNGVAPQFKGTNFWFVASSSLLFSVPFLLWG
ncbi:hypothetical protein SADUNF_Sadunf08G0076500 [Salix dunnii]|uniref:Uncharacterized protein n=1 Tax=Salix dunnii TaxID=1413687 RepID=A0A835N173_9ROSI|nr:hypothetical protein SADUNF_Sadunf08G0076500 [Salix dunnii]